MIMEKKKIILGLFGLFLLIGSVSAEIEMVYSNCDYDSGVCVEPIRDIINNSDIFISSLRDIQCEWRNPNDKFKYCIVIVEIQNRKKDSMILQGDIFNIDSVYPISDISYSHSRRYKNITMEYVRETDNETEVYTKFIKEWIDFKDGKPIKIESNEFIGIKIKFMSPIVIEKEIYQRNKFNFIIIEEETHILDPDISGCSMLGQADSIYYLTADIINDTSMICMFPVANNITLDCQGHIIDGDGILGDIGIGIYGTTNITIRNCILTNWGNLGYIGSSAIHMGGSDCLIRDSIVNNNGGGIFISGWSTNNIIRKVNITNNNQYGILSMSMIGNYIYNNLFNNTQNVIYLSNRFLNHWNTTKQIGTRIYSSGTEIGGNYWTNSLGNGYSDMCIDFNTDGFCDIQYYLYDYNIDYFPLSNKYTITSTTTTSTTTTLKYEYSFDNIITTIGGGVDIGYSILDLIITWLPAIIVMIIFGLVFGVFERYM